MYDLLVIGGGPAGYRAAERAGEEGLSVCLFEKAAIGGVCLNEGCVPSKTLLHTAKLLEHARDGKPFGVITEDVRLDLEALLKRKDRIVRQLTSGVAATLKNANVTVVDGTAQVVSTGPDVRRVSCAGQEYEGRFLLLATGSKPVIPPIPGLDKALASGFAVTSREALSPDSIPSRMLVIGAGVIGLELAGFYHAAGADVTVVEMLDRIAGNADRETAENLQKKYKRKGIRFLLSTTVTGIKDGTVSLDGPDGAEALETDRILLSAGRAADVSSLGLDDTDIRMERGCIPINGQCRTNVDGVYAAGDITGSWMLAHVAYREAETAVDDMLGRSVTMSYNAVPSVVYTQPEMASVGLTEEQCRARGAYLKASVPMGFSGRFLAETHRETGFCKVLTDPESGHLLGCHILGPYASEIVVASGILIEAGVIMEDVKSMIFPHPTVGEVLREAAFRLNEAE